MRTIVTVFALLVLVLVGMAAPRRAVGMTPTEAWNQNAPTYNFDTVTTPIAGTTTLLSMYNGSNYTMDLVRQWAATGADLDDPKTEPVEPESAVWNDILNW